MITTVRYTNAQNTGIVVDDQTWLAWPSDTHWDADVQEWIDAGNTITPFAEFYGWTLPQAQAAKTRESEQYAADLIHAANAHPQQGLNVDPDLHRRRADARRKDKADKQAGELALDEDEKNQAKVDQKMSEYEGKCWAASDKAIKEIDKGDDVAEVMALEIPTITTWPVWEPPL